MGKRLYVGNLPYDADEAALREVFGQDGRVVERVHIVLDRETQRPRGFAFVEMATDDQARQAIAKLEGTMFGTRNLRVTEAEERRPGGPGGARPDRPMSSSGPRPGGGFGGGGGGGGAPRSYGDERNRFGPDARPKHEQQQRRAAPKRRLGGESSEGDGGRRGNSRFDDDEE